MASHGHSEACCNTPVAVVDSYKEKGSFIDVNGTKVYKTGPAKATSAILVVYDIFGFSPQALQGADILAHEDDEHHQYQVFIPDFLKGNYADHSWFPPDTEEKQKKLGDYFSGPAKPGDTASRVPTIVKDIEAKVSGISQWGILGYCWGGKVVSLSSQSGTQFKVGAEVHPAMVDADDAKGISIPLCMLASGDEPADDVKKFEDALSGPKHVETFKDQVHGWMAARGDLKQERVKAEYERGYKTLLDFYHKHL